MKEKISMQLQIPLALIIVTLLPIVSAQALSDDATTTIGRQIQSEVEINLEILNSLPSNDLSLGTVKIGKPKKNFMPAQEAKDTGSKINKTTSTNSIGAITPPTKPIISLSQTPSFVPPKKNTPISVPKKYFLVARTHFHERPIQLELLTQKRTLTKTLWMFQSLKMIIHQ